MSDRPPTGAELQRLLDDWNTWLAAHTDSLLSLEERVQTAGTATDRADLAAAFVTRKAIADRVAAIAATASRDRSGAAALAGQPLTDDLGGLIGNDLNDAAQLLDLVLQKVEAAVRATETSQATEAQFLRQAEEDLAVAERLASVLGMHVNHVDGLRQRLAARSDLASVAVAAASARANLEAAERERTTLLRRATAAVELMAELTATEARVRALAERCREKVVQAPPLAVPSVAALEAPDDPSALDGLPFAALRAQVTPMLHRLDRVAAALAEAERRFREPLARRDELRGLLQAYGDKAAAHRVFEDAELDPMYREAKSVLWDAPCDLASGARLVEQYIAAVNAKIVGVAK